MTIAAGTKFDHYEILSPLGAGGMGEVYRALDTRLDRAVALKVLPADFAKDADRLRRFEQEARATSALNHPNILTVHDIGTHEGMPYIVAELLEGEELRAQLDDGALPVRKALEYAQQVAAGLAAAHEKGVVHRDLKPENLFVTKGGRIKILDFGLAKLKPQKLSGGVDSEAPTLKPLTDPGVIMGTVGYMSPEQVRGQEADTRADIFSFGMILYEMLSGKRAFSGTSVADVMSAITRDDPPELSESNAKISPALDKIVRRCLEKKPELRFQSASDLGFALGTLTTPSGSRIETVTALPAVTESLPVKARLFGQTRLWMAVTAALLLALLAVLPFAVAHLRHAPPTEASAARFAIAAPEKVMTLLSPEISPDGRQLVFATLSNGKTSLWLRPLGSLTAQQLPGTEPVSNPHFFSPDSRSVVFPAEGKLKKLDLAGGAVQTLCAMPRSNVQGAGGGGGSWNGDGIILFTSGGKIYRVASSGGEPELVLGSPQPEPDAYYRWPSFLPDGRHFLYLKTSVQQGTGASAICVGSLDGRETARLRAADSHALYTAAAGGHLIYALDGALVAQAFDAQALKLSGEPFAIADSVTVNGQGRGLFSISDTGSLIFDPSRNFGAWQLTWVDRTGKPLESFGESKGYVGNPRLSPDGKQVTFARQDYQTRTRDIYVMDITRGISSRLTFDPGEDYAPIWSPDGKRIAWASNRDGPLAIYQKLASGVGQDELLLKMDVDIGPDTWSPDGRFLLFDRTDPKTREDLWVLPMDGERKPFLFLQTPFNEGVARFSPDGRFIAYRSDDQGRKEVYVQTFPASGNKWQISNNGGSFAIWRNDGREIFYISADGKLMSVEIKPGSGFEAGVPKPLFDLAPLRAIGFGGSIAYAPAPDGQRFLVNRQMEAQANLQYVLVMNWAAEVKK